MSRLPVIVGFGGYNAAGRSSFHHGFRRYVLDSLDAGQRQQTLASLAVLMGLVVYRDGQYHDGEGQPLDLATLENRFGEQIRAGTLIRRIDKQYLDVDAVHWQKNLTVSGAQFTTLRKHLPEPLPASWTIEALDEQQVRVTLNDSCEFKVDSYRALPVKSAGQLPSGFEPGELYHSHFHPRGLQLAVTGATDALRSTGINWRTIQDHVQPDEVAVFAGSIMSQLDEYGFGGMLQSRLKGGRVTAKQCPLGLNTMPADFINAYVLGSVGTTGSVTGACATFLYNLQKAAEQIASGKARVALVGNAEAPITPEIIDGYGAMGALATEEGLRKIEGREEVDFQRARRPFGDNCGFTLAESAQYVVLMDDALALELGADIHGSVPDVFVNADGFKKSISAPGPGNYLTLAKAVASTMALVGTETVRQHSFVHAHGSSTPANRVTESELLDRIAGAFAIESWPVTAVKAYVGHSLAAASADQLMAALGTFASGILPGIKTIDRVADDVHRQHLEIVTADRQQPLQVAFLNSKGFGGNNASAAVLAPSLVEKLLQRRHGESTLAAWRQRREQTRAEAAAYDQRALQGELGILYRFGEALIDEHELHIDQQQIRVPGFAQPIQYAANPGYADLSEG